MDKQRIIELNVPAKVKALEALKKQRRNDMRRWRKSPTLMFGDMAVFKEWLDNTKWHKRPVKVNDYGYAVLVEFLDYKKA